MFWRRTGRNDENPALAFAIGLELLDLVEQ
jgi:hypothetical protein